MQFSQRAKKHSGGKVARQRQWKHSDAGGTEDSGMFVYVGESETGDRSLKAFNTQVAVPC